MQLFVDIIRSYTDVVLFFIVWLGIGLIYVLRQKRRLEREIQRRKDVEEAELERESRGRLTGLDVMVATTSDDEPAPGPSYGSAPPIRTSLTENAPVVDRPLASHASRAPLPSPPPAPEPRSPAMAAVTTGADQEAQALLTQYTSGDGGGVEEMERMLERDPNNLQLLDWLAFMYYSNNDAVKAIATYRRIIAIEPNNASQHYYLGNCFFKNNEIERAIEEWNLVVQLKPGSKYARKAQERMTKLGTISQ